MDVTLSDKTYRIGKLNAINQSYVFKRIAPLVLSALGALSNIGQFIRVPSSDKSDGDQHNDASMSVDYVAMAAPFVSVLAKMPDDDMTFVFKVCLEKVSMIDGKESHPIMVNGQIMYDTIPLLDLMHLTWLVIRDDLLNFIAGIATALDAQ